jgi:hypothetical protein
VKTRQHLVNLLGDVGFDIHASGERVSVAFENDDGDVAARFQFRERLLKFARHAQVDDVQRRVDQLDAGDGRRDFYFDSSCNGGGHLRR